MRKLIYICWLLLACNTHSPQNKNDKLGQSQQEVTEHDKNVFPEVGKPMPDFTLNNVQYYDKQQVSLKEFKGQWLIMDFWNRRCINCIKSFPKVNQLRKGFKGKVEFILVGRNDGKHYSGAEEVYQRVRKKNDLELPLVYEAGLFERFGVSSVPHIIWIDDKGIVRAITTSTDLNAENIQTFLDGKNPGLVAKLNSEEERKKQEAYNFKRPLLVDGNGGEADNFLYRSILTGFNDNFYGNAYPSFFPPLSDNMLGLTAINVSLKNLYKIAYNDTIRLNPDVIGQPNNYGKWWYTPIIEVSNDNDFKTEWRTGKGLYCYQLIVPESKRVHTLFRQKLMQRDLENYFGYEATVQTRVMPYWRVTAIKKETKKLMTKGGKAFKKGDGTNIVLQNQPVEVLIRLLWGLHQLGPPFIDDTGIEGNIDLDIEGELTDFEELRKRLKVKGVELKKGKKEMKVVVIRDSKENK